MGIIEDANRAAALTEVDRKLAAGEITPQEADAQRAAINSAATTSPPTEPVNPTPAATPAAVEHAEATGVDLAQVEGSGTKGKITKADVAEAAAELPPAAPIPTSDGDVADLGNLDGYEFFYCLRAGHPGATDLIGDPSRIFAAKLNSSTGPLTGPPFCPVCQQQVVAHAAEVTGGKPQIPTSIVALGERLSAPVNT